MSRKDPMQYKAGADLSRFGLRSRDHEANPAFIVGEL